MANTSMTDFFFPLSDSFIQLKFYDRASFDSQLIHLSVLLFPFRSFLPFLSGLSDLVVVVAVAVDDYETTPLLPE
jgi:hypothetical protein